MEETKMAAAMVTAFGDSRGFNYNVIQTSWDSEIVLDQGLENPRHSMPLVQWMIDEQGVFTLSEGEGLSTLGLEPGEIVGKSIYDVYANFPQILDNVQRALNGEVVNDTVELEDQIWDSRYYPVRGENGKISGIVGTAFNITEQHKRERRPAAIVNVASALRKAATRSEMPQIISVKLAELLDTNSAALIIQNSYTDEMVVEFSQGKIWSSNIKNHREKLISASKQVLQVGMPYVENEYTQIPDADRHYAAVGIPLIAQEFHLGVLWVGREAPFTASSIELLFAIGDMAANALHRATQHERTEQRLSRIAALHAIDKAITESLDLRVTLSVLLDQVIRQLGVDACNVFLYDPDSNTLNYSDGIGFEFGSLMNSSLNLGEGLVGRVALYRDLIEIRDLTQTDTKIARSTLITQELFASYYGVPLITRGKLKGVLEVFQRHPLNVDSEWVEFLKTLATQAAIAIETTDLFADIQQSNSDLKQAYTTTLEGWVRALDLRDKETKGHARRVSKRTVHLGRVMGMSEEELVHARRGALLHDIGKIGIPDEILKKPGALTDHEKALMREHPSYAFEMLKQIKFLRPALDIPHYHHERWDGSGYPHRLRGLQIPLAARIFAVIDVWDALSSDRPYRRAWPKKKIYAYILDQAGYHFDPQVVAAWVDAFDIKIN